MAGFPALIYRDFMKADINTVKQDDTVIFLCDEYRNGKKECFDGKVLYTTEQGAEVLYLSGYRSRNDLVPFEDIIAKVDLSMPEIKLDEHPYSGHFIKFTQ